MKIILVSVPGGGKTTIMQIVKKKLPEIKIINYGDEMLKIAKEKYGITNRDEMRKKIPLKEYRKLQTEAAKNIAKIKEDIIIDTHLSIKMQGGYYPGLPEEAIKEIKPDVIVLTEFNPEDIIERRKKDMSLTQAIQKEGIVSIPRTGREIENLEEIEMHQTINRLFAASVANISQSLIVIINLRFKQKKEFEHAEIAANKIADLFLNYKKISENFKK